MIPFNRPALVGIRHVALRVADLGAVERFWVEVMGYRVEWRPDADNVYLSSGADNLALHQAVGELLSGEQQPLDHLGFIVDSPEAVRAAAEALRRRGVPIIAEPRAHRDGSWSLYCADPDGNRVQVLYEPNVSRRAP